MQLEISRLHFFLAFKYLAKLPIQEKAICLNNT